MAEEPLYTNRLIHQKSPYLLQHAHNPVEWYPWGDEALQVAKEKDKPIFLSIGYATCHWCHVMERESFENVEVAHLLNQTFINIKVDREELPDVDSLYMEFAQSMMSGAAGWPLNILLTPDLQPFFAATYLPAYSSHGLMGLSDLIQRVGELWQSNDKEKVISQAETILEVFASSVHTTGEALPEVDVIEEAIELLYKMADPTYGGLKGAPKFPIGYQSSLLLRYFVAKKDNRALFLVERTLDMMHRGGIYDQIGGGFSRYSVDERWIIPHFEKMLYDNAILAQSYLEAWQMTKKPLYRDVCIEILNYILRDMTHPEGGFFSAEDADSEGHEGHFYTWPRNEVLELLGPDGLLFSEYYHITPHGNFDGRNILHQLSSLEEFAQIHHLSVEELQKKFNQQKKILWEAREKRVHPMKDDKVLSSWNGLMIYTLTEAGKALDYEPFLQAAIKCARFLKKTMWVEDQQMLLRRWREGEALFAGSLDEYAFLTRGLISLFEANAGIEWLQWAIQLTHSLSSHYKVPDGAFFQTDGTDKTLILQRCQFSDGAEPSGNAIQTENLLRLYQITKQEEFIAQASDVLMAVKDLIEQYPLGYTYHVMNLLRYYDREAPTFIIALNSNDEFYHQLKKQLYEKYLPHGNIIWQSQDLEFEETLPHLQHQQAVGDKTTLYLCQQGICHEPITDFAEMVEVINKF